MFMEVKRCASSGTCEITMTVVFFPPSQERQGPFIFRSGKRQIEGETSLSLLVSSVFSLLLLSFSLPVFA